MFNDSLKKEALKIHEHSYEKYNSSYQKMSDACESLYATRIKAVELVSFVQKIVNSIANTPKSFDIQLRKISQQVYIFHDTEEFARRSYEESVRAGTNTAYASIAGVSVATLAPTALACIATTFGTASTGTAISALSGAAAQKAAVAWIGRTFAGFAVEGSAGMLAGQAFLALVGPIGWSIAGVTAGLALIKFSNKNKEIADDAFAEAKEMYKAKEALDEASASIIALNTKTNMLYIDLIDKKWELLDYANKDYASIEESQKFFLGMIINNTLSLSHILNESILQYE